MTATSWAIFLLVIAFLVVVLHVVVGVFVSIKRKNNKYPKPGEATMRNVDNLIRQGEFILAIRCYRDVKKSSLAEARDYVEGVKINIKK